MSETFKTGAALALNGFAGSAAPLALAVSPFEADMARRHFTSEFVERNGIHESTAGELHQLGRKAAARAAASAFGRGSDLLAETITYPDLEGRMTSAFRVRLLDGREPKYLSVAGMPPHAYLPRRKPGDKSWREIANDTSIAAMFTESEFGASVAYDRGFNCIGFAGCFGFGSKKCGMSLPPELKSFQWQGRRVTIVFDSDSDYKPGVIAALHALARELRKLGAHVTYKTLPDGHDGKKQGLDDFLVSGGNLDEIQERGFEADDLVAKIDSRFMFCEQPVGVIDTQSAEGITIYSPYDARELLRDRNYMDIDPSGRPVKRFAFDTWNENPTKRRCKRLVFNPGQIGITDRAEYSAWLGWGAPEPIKGDVSPWRKALDHVSNGEAEIAKVLEQGAAYPVAYPGTKIHWAVILVGPTFAFKSNYFRVVSAVYDPSHVGEIGQEELLGNFNEHCRFKQFLRVDEPSSTDKRKEAPKLKRLLTQEWLTCNGKFERKFRIRDTINYGFSSNDPVAAYLEDDDRRFYVVEVKNQIAPKLGTEIVQWAESPEGRAALLYHFMHDVDLSGFDPHGRAPESPARTEMIIAGRSDIGFVHSVADNIIEDAAKRGEPHYSDLRTVNYLAGQFKDVFNKEPTHHAVANAIRRDRRWTSLDRIRVGDLRYTVFAAANGPYWKGVTSKAVAKAIKDGGNG